MITLCDDIDKFEDNDYCLIKMKCLKRAYGYNMPFLNFYEWHDGNNCGVICKFYSAVTVWLNCEKSKEVQEFIEFLGYGQLLCNVPIFKNTYSVFAKSQNNISRPPSRNYTADDYKKVYDIFANSNSEDVTLGDFDDFYVDISYRVRHFAADIFASERSAGILLYDGKNALLNGIAVKPEYRGRGESGKVLGFFEENAYFDNIYVMCRKELDAYYLKQGFKFIKDVYFKRG